MQKYLRCNNSFKSPYYRGQPCITRLISACTRSQQLLPANKQYIVVRQPFLRMNQNYSLPHKTKCKINLIRQELCNKLRKECISHFNKTELKDLPVLMFHDALNKQFEGKEVRVLRRSKVGKQKVSLKIDDRQMSIGECDSSEVASIIEYVKKNRQDKKIGHKEQRSAKRD